MHSCFSTSSSSSPTTFFSIQKFNYRLFRRSKDDVEGRLLDEDVDEIDLITDFSGYRKNVTDRTNITPL